MLNETKSSAVLEFMRLHPGEVESLSGRSMPNTLGLERKVSFCFKPSHRGSLAKMLAFCHDQHIPVHPFSMGKNWGLGSKLPAIDGVSILDLSAMNKIIDYDAELGTITIEPGVTQKQAADFLVEQKSNFFLDVTGSGEDSSVIGNALERGVAYHSQRTADVLAFEVLTPSGEVFKSGFSNADDKIAALYPHGIGPEVSGLFFQSSFGVVMQMTIALKKKQETSISLIANFKEEKIEEFVKGVMILLAEGSLDFIPHIASRKRFLEIAEPLLVNYQKSSGQNINITKVLAILERTLPHDWILSGSISGPQAIVANKIKRVHKVLGSTATIRTQSGFEEKAAEVLSRLGIKEFLFMFNAFAGLRGLGRGVPSNDAIFAFDPAGKDPDTAEMGFLYVVPIGPLTSTAAKKFVEIKNAVDQKYGIESAMTLNPVNGHVLESVWSVSFVKNDSTRKETAIAAGKDFMAECRKHGFLPYRLPTALPQEHDLHSDSHKKLIAQLKDYFDPHHILSPGRYS